MLSLVFGLATSAFAFRLPPFDILSNYISPRLVVSPYACAADLADPSKPQPAPIETYAAAEARGFELYRAGSYDRAIRMFELAQKLPGDGYDYQRQKQGGMAGSASAPNPRELAITRFATSEQKMIAQYNIACCYAAMGDAPRTLEIIRAYLSQAINCRTLSRYGV